MTSNGAPRSMSLSNGAPVRSMSLAPKMSMAAGADCKPSTNRVTINVGGVKYETFKTTLKNLPDTRLAWLCETTAHNPDYDQTSGEYFFDRHPGMFLMILNYYRTGKLHAPMDVCGPLFEEELLFWGIDEKQIEPCCYLTYRTHRDAQETLAEFVGESEESSDEDEAGDVIAKRFGIEEEAKAELTKWQKWQPRIWVMLEQPSSSTAAMAVACVSGVFIILSILSFVLESVLDCRDLLPEYENITLTFDSTVNDVMSHTKPQLFLQVLEYVTVIYFTIEFVIRISFVPSRCAFVSSFINIIDVMSLLPFYVLTVLRIIDGTNYTFYNYIALVRVFQGLKLIRIFRIFRICRHFSGLQVIIHTMKASSKELLLLIMVVYSGVLIFAVCVYYAEQIAEDPTNYFKNIPVGFWWALVTMTTLGYGDMYPKTIPGYIVGMFCAISGVLVIALPVPVIVNNFATFYSHAQARLKLPKKRRRVLMGAADALKAQGDEDAEDGRSTSLPSVDGKSDERKNSDQPSELSEDSGIRTASSEPIGMSVIFTDEIALKEITKTDSFKKDKDRRGSYKSRSGSISNGIIMNGDLHKANGVNNNSIKKNPPNTRRRSLNPKNNMTDIEV